MQIDFVIFHLYCRTSGIKVPLLSNDLSKRTCLAICPAQRELLRSLSLWLRKRSRIRRRSFGSSKEEPNRLLTWLTSTPTKTFSVLECRFDWMLGIFRRDFHPSNFFKVRPFLRRPGKVWFSGLNYMFPHTWSFA